MTGTEEIFWVIQSKHDPDSDLTAKTIAASVHAEDAASDRRGSREDPEWKLQKRKSRTHLDTALGPPCVTQFPFPSAWGM